VLSLQRFWPKATCGIKKQLRISKGFIQRCAEEDDLSQPVARQSSAEYILGWSATAKKPLGMRIQQEVSELWKLRLMPVAVTAGGFASR
jgi:hypothetical protein